MLICVWGSAVCASVLSPSVGATSDAHAPTRGRPVPIPPSGGTWHRTAVRHRGDRASSHQERAGARRQEVVHDELGRSLRGDLIADGGTHHGELLARDDQFPPHRILQHGEEARGEAIPKRAAADENGRASRRSRVCHYVELTVVAVTIK